MKHKPQDENATSIPLSCLSQQALSRYNTFEDGGSQPLPNLSGAVPRDAESAAIEGTLPQQTNNAVRKQYKPCLTKSQIRCLLTTFGAIIFSTIAITPFIGIFISYFRTRTCLLAYSSSDPITFDNSCDGQTLGHGIPRAPCGYKEIPCGNSIVTLYIPAHHFLFGSAGPAGKQGLTCQPADANFSGWLEGSCQENHTFSIVNSCSTTDENTAVTVVPVCR